MKQNGTIKRFPWKLCLLNGLIYFLARLDIIGILYSGSVLVIPFKASIAIIQTAILMVISLVFQLTLYGCLRHITGRRLVYAVLFLLPGTMLGGNFFYWSLPRMKAQAILKDVELAPLPKSASGIKVFSWSTGFSGCMFLRFRASRDDIESFLSVSPILKEAEYQRFSKERVRLIEPDDYHQQPQKYRDGNEYFQPTWSAPAWYVEEVKGAGRRYSFIARKFGHGAEVIIDEQQNLVFVRLSLG